jgi:hypothetical protein
MNARSIRRLTAVAAGALTLVLAGGGGADADARCREVRGRYTEQLAPDGCTSPYGFCIAARYTAGPLHGTFEGAVTSFVTSADSATTDVSLFTTDTIAEVTAWGRHGTLTIKNAGAFHGTGRGEIVDLQTITGGTGDFAGATGALRASGTFDLVAGSGESTVAGTVCLP